MSDITTQRVGYHEKIATMNSRSESVNKKLVIGLVAMLVLIAIMFTLFINNSRSIQADYDALLENVKLATNANDDLTQVYDMLLIENTTGDGSELNKAKEFTNRVAGSVEDIAAIEAEGGIEFPDLEALQTATGEFTTASLAFIEAYKAEDLDGRDSNFEKLSLARAEIEDYLEAYISNEMSNINIIRTTSEKATTLVSTRSLFLILLVIILMFLVGNYATLFIKGGFRRQAVLDFDNAEIEVKSRIRDRSQKTIIYVLLILLLTICLIPFYTMVVNATRSAGQIVSGFSLLPSSHFLENFESLEEYVMVWRGLLNSATIAVSTTLLTAYFSTLTAFGFQFYEFKGKNILFGFMLLMMMVPQQLGLIGFYQLCLKIGWLDSYKPLIIPAIANTFGVFFIRQYMAGSVHPALIEAARIDGSGEIAIFHKLILPLAAPATATMSIMGFIANWNNYLAPRVLIFSLDKRPLPVMVGALKGSIVAQSNFGATYAAVAISVLPVMIVFVFASRYIINGIGAGSVKG